MKFKLSSSRIPQTLAASLLAFAALSFLSAPLLAEVYTIRLKSGNEFISKYEPRQAWYSEEKLLIMTTTGNIVALEKADIDEVFSTTEAQGFGVIIDTNTILVGTRPNDAPVLDDAAINQAIDRASQLRALQGPAGSAPVNNPLFSEPNRGGGLPVGFLNTVTPPIGPPR